MGNFSTKDLQKFYALPQIPFELVNPETTKALCRHIQREKGMFLGCILYDRDRKTEFSLSIIIVPNHAPFVLIVLRDDIKKILDTLHVMSAFLDINWMPTIDISERFAKMNITQPSPLEWGQLIDEASSALRMSGSEMKNNPEHHYKLHNKRSFTCTDLLYLLYIGKRHGYLFNYTSAKSRDYVYDNKQPDNHFDIVCIFFAKSIPIDCTKAFFKIANPLIDCDFMRVISSEGNHSLIWSVANGTWDHTMILLDYINDANVINFEDSEGKDSLLIACIKGYRRIDGKIKTNDGDYIYTDACQLVERLLEKNAVTTTTIASIENVEGQGWTPLHFAAAHRNPELIKVLLDASADKNALSDNGKTPLDVTKLDYSIVQKLCETLVYATIISDDMIFNDQTINSGLKVLLDPTFVAAEYKMIHEDEENLSRCKLLLQ